MVYQPFENRYFCASQMKKHVVIMYFITTIIVFIIAPWSTKPLGASSVPSHSCQTYKNIPEIIAGSITVVGLYAPDVTKTELENYRNYCPYVQLHPFTVSAYPKYFNNLKNYRFKFPTVASVLSEFRTLMYLDASIRFNVPENETLTDLFKLMETKYARSGILLLRKTFHKNFPVTHLDMYGFFNVTAKQMKETFQFYSGLYLINNSSEGWKILNNMILCAMEPKCMAPPGATAKCNYPMLHQTDRVICHRFDQSALNMRMIELYGTNESLYYYPSPIVNVVQMNKCHVSKK